MEDALPLEIVRIIILLVLSAFFSSSESAFFSIDYITREKLKKKGNPSRAVYNLLTHPNRLLITILVGNMFVNILASSVASGLAIKIMSKLQMADIIGTSITIGVMSIIILMFGEISPKMVAITKPVQFARRFSYPMKIIVILLRPVTILFQYLADIITNKIIKYSAEPEKEGDIESIIKIGHKEGIIDEDEKAIIENIFQSINKEVSQIMMPRPKVYSVNIEKGDKYIINNIIKHDYPRVLVYKETKDSIQGVIRKKDILPLIFNLKREKSISEIIKPVLYIPENKKINNLLREFQNEKKDFAVVVDEYGGTLGVVTIENVIETIMGEYKTEYEKENGMFRKIGKNKYLIQGDMEISEFNQIFKCHLKTESSETISGLIMEHTEKIPRRGEKIIIGDFDFAISKMKGPKILTVIVEVP
ncbi:MAG: HlyC/CorC family transporter [Spirochaetes bacterium]|nr:HlyC/CorC family transporter [Spirochaetota bacterium]